MSARKIQHEEAGNKALNNIYCTRVRQVPLISVNKRCCKDKSVKYNLCHPVTTHTLGRPPQQEEHRCSEATQTSTSRTAINLLSEVSIALFFSKSKRQPSVLGYTHMYIYIYMFVFLFFLQTSS